MNSIIPWPWKKKYEADLEKLNEQEWIDQWMFDPLTRWEPDWNTPFANSFPAIDVAEKEKEIVVKAELPGVNEKDLKLEYQEGVLTIRGEKTEKSEDKKSRLKEIKYGSFSRSLPLGDSVDFTKAKASYKKGVLKLEIPRTKESSKTKSIPIN